MNKNQYQIIAQRLEKGPQKDKSAYAAPNATIIGEVYLEEDSSVWFSAVLRGDVNYIRIGKGSNIQDGSVIHVREALPTIVGENVTVGHMACLHGCTIGNNVLIGIGAIVLDGAVIPDNCIVAAGSLIAPGKTYPEYSMIMGNPAKVTRTLTEKDLELIRVSADDYREYKRYFTS